MAIIIRLHIVVGGEDYGGLELQCTTLHMEQPYTVTKDGVQGVINEAGTFMTDEEALDYEGYLVGEYNSEF